MSANLLTINDLHFTYEKQINPTIKGVTIDVKRGEFLCLLAPSGAGKSTIFRLLTGLEHPQSGSITIHQSKEIQMGYMPQKDLLLEWRTMIDNVILPLELNGMNKKQARLHAQTHMNEFGLGGTDNKYPYELSGGMRQRASFLRAVVNGCDLLLLDEPFSALDAITRKRMQDWLKEMCKKLSLTTILVTHDLDEATKLGTRILLFNEAPLSKYQEFRPTANLSEQAELKQQMLDQLSAEGSS